jgi:hypothetical protein
LLVEFARPKVTCYAPPGTSLDGDRGLELGCWRRGTWQRESDLYERCDPVAVERMPMTAVRAALPDDFHAWATHETAAYLARLRTFTYHRPSASGAAETVGALWSDLERAFPQATEHYWISETSTSLASPGSTSHAEPVRASLESRLSPRTMRRREWGAFVVQFAAIPLLYVCYRLFLHHEVEIPGQNVHLGTIFGSPFRSVLLWLYGSAHVPLTFGFLLWVYFRRNLAFMFVRNAVLAGASLAIFGSRLASRLSGEPIYSLSAQHGVPPNAIPTMPAVHLVTAAVLGICGALLVRSRIAQMLWIAYPLAVVAVITAHPPLWLLPTLGAGLACALAAWGLMYLAGRVKPTWSEPPELAERRHAITHTLSRAQRQEPPVGLVRS